MLCVERLLRGPLVAFPLAAFTNQAGVHRPDLALGGCVVGIFEELNDISVEFLVEGFLLLFSFFAFCGFDSCFDARQEGDEPAGVGSFDESCFLKRVCGFVDSTAREAEQLCGFVVFDPMPLTGIEVAFEAAIEV